MVICNGDCRLLFARSGHLTLMNIVPRFGGSQTGPPTSMVLLKHDDPATRVSPWLKFLTLTPHQRSARFFAQHLANFLPVFDYFSQKPTVVALKLTLIASFWVFLVTKFIELDLV